MIIINKCVELFKQQTSQISHKKTWTWLTKENLKRETESIQENKTYKLLWDLEIQTDHQISTRQPDLVIVIKEKRTC